MKKIIKLEIKPIQFGYVVRILEQSHFGHEFGERGSWQFITPFLTLKSNASPEFYHSSFACQGSARRNRNKKLVLLYTEGTGERAPCFIHASKKWCDNYIKKLKKAVKYYNEYHWG
jgi:hypothetical protein